MKKTGFLIRAIRVIRGKDFYWSPSLTRRVGMFLVVRYWCLVLGALFFVLGSREGAKSQREEEEKSGRLAVGLLLIASCLQKGLAG